jgi:uncharacterized membrane protein YfcA
VSHWWASLLTPEVAWLALVFATPAVVGVALGMHLFHAVDHVRLRHLVFALLFVLGFPLWPTRLSTLCSASDTACHQGALSSNRLPISPWY